MAFCPNCSAELPGEAHLTRCWNCHADFADGSSWTPTKTPAGIFREFRALQTGGPPLDPVPEKVVAGEKRPFAYYLGKLLPCIGYAALFLAWLVSCVGMTKFGGAILIGLWASVFLVPIIMIGHVLARFGAADA